MKIAVLESDTHDAQLLEEWLCAAGHTSRFFVSGSDFMRGLSRNGYEVIIIGSTGNDLGGTEIILALRQQWTMTMPIIRLLRNASESDIVAAFKAGADDCIVQPARQFELLARMEALVRRTHRLQPPEEERLEYGALSIDVKNRLILRDGERVTLTPKTYNLALILLSNTGQLLSRAYLMEHVWGHDKAATTRTLDTHISRLRTVLGLTPGNGWHLQSVYQHGYRLDRAEPKPSPRAVQIAEAHAQSFPG